MSDRVRFGLIGYGLFGSHHAAAIAAGEDTELAAVAVRSVASQEAVCEDHPGVDVCADYEELLARKDIDIISVVAPNVLHYEVGKAVLNANKHLLMEKPMALRVDQCDELVSLAETRGRVLAVGHELRLSSLWGGVKELIDQGVIGRPLYAMIELSRFPYRQGSEGWRYDIERVGSWILEEPIHFFDLARWYLSACGEPVSVYARANSRQRHHPELKDNFSAIVNFAGGAYAVVSQTLSAFGHHQTAKITGTEGAIWARWSAADARSEETSFELRYGLGNNVETMAFDKPTGELLELADEIAAVAQCVKTGEAPPCAGIDGRWSTLLCLAAERSVEKQRVIEIDQFLQSSR